MTAIHCNWTKPSTCNVKNNKFFQFLNRIPPLVKCLAEEPFFLVAYSTLHISKLKRFWTVRFDWLRLCLSQSLCTESIPLARSFLPFASRKFKTSCQLLDVASLYEAILGMTVARGSSIQSFLTPLSPASFICLHSASSPVILTGRINGGNFVKK